MIYHYGFLKAGDGKLYNFLNHGYLAVDLFFVLSGFVMALTYGHLFQNGFKSIDYKIFMERRFARIYPLYIFATILAIFHEHIFLLKPYDPETPPLAVRNVTTHVFLIQAWGFSKSYMGTTWSISSEMLAYVLFPILISLSLFKGRTIATLSFVASFITLLTLYMNWFDFYPNKIGSLSFSHGGYFSAILRCISEFTLGILAYRLFSIDDIRKKIQNAYVQISVITVICGLLFLYYTDLIIAILLPILIISLSSDKGIVARVLSTKPFYALGVISYSLYLMHIIPFWFRGNIQEVLEGINIPYADSISLALQIPISICFATATYFLIEKPGRVTLQKFIGRSKAEKHETIHTKS